LSLEPFLSIVPLQSTEPFQSSEPLQSAEPLEEPYPFPFKVLGTSIEWTQHPQGKKGNLSSSKKKEKLEAFSREPSKYFEYRTYLLDLFLFGGVQYGSKRYKLFNPNGLYRNGLIEQCTIKDFGEFYSLTNRGLDFFNTPEIRKKLPIKTKYQKDNLPYTDPLSSQKPQEAFTLLTKVSLIEAANQIADQFQVQIKDVPIFDFSPSRDFEKALEEAKKKLQDLQDFTLPYKNRFTRQFFTVEEASEPLFIHILNCPSYAPLLTFSLYPEKMQALKDLAEYMAQLSKNGKYRLDDPWNLICLDYSKDLAYQKALHLQEFLDSSRFHIFYGSFNESNLDQILPLEEGDELIRSLTNGLE
ncbi:MAG: hypothetical protein K2H85_09175, partial [Allobaculum sp.]|nr:hypothetical protein [Allobaculum sp.]